MPANRKGWLSEVCTSPHHRARQSTSTRVSGLSKATSRRPSYAGAVPVGGPSPGERQCQLLGGGERPAGRSCTVCPTTSHMHALLLGISHKSHHPSRRQVQKAGGQGPRWNEMLSVLRSDWNGPALKVGKPTFLTCVHHPVFPFKEPEPEEYEF